MKSKLLLKVRRFQNEKQPPQWIDTFEVETRKGMNLLEALLKIQEEQDGTFSLRYSCRGAVCGSCAMKVNGELVLACRTPVEKFLKKKVFIEPLPSFPVIRDLIVDMSLFFHHYKSIDPYLHPQATFPDRENLMSDERRKEIDPYIQCILCGICFGACPAFKREETFLGPAVLAKIFRFFKDPRDRREGEILKIANHQKGVWGCNTVFQCVHVCPKKVPPTHAIVKMRKSILKIFFASLLHRSSSHIFKIK